MESPLNTLPSTITVTSNVENEETDEDSLVTAAEGDDKRQGITRKPVGTVQRSSEGRKKTSTAKKGRKKPEGMPKRPLSAYNLFFRAERRSMLGDDLAKKFPINDDNRTKRKHRKTHGKIGFTELARVISVRWKSLDKFQKLGFVQQAEAEKERYFEKMEIWKKEQQRQQQQSELAANTESIAHDNVTDDKTIPEGSTAEVSGMDARETSQSANRLESVTEPNKRAENSFSAAATSSGTWQSLSSRVAVPPQSLVAHRQEPSFGSNEDSFPSLRKANPPFGTEFLRAGSIPAGLGGSCNTGAAEGPVISRLSLTSGLISKPLATESFASQPIPLAASANTARSQALSHYNLCRMEELYHFHLSRAAYLKEELCRHYAVLGTVEPASGFLTKDSLIGNSCHMGQQPDVSADLLTIQHGKEAEARLHLFGAEQQSARNDLRNNMLVKEKAMFADIRKQQDVLQ